MNADGPTAEAPTFDHIAIAVERITDPWPLLVDALGGRYLDRGAGPGFGWTQLRFANGFVVEGLHPERPDAGSAAGSDFVRRFLDRSGPGPHHLTFKVADLDAALVACRSAGLSPVAEDRSDPTWHEAFLHPSEAHGVVVQLAATPAPPPPPLPEPEGFPEFGYEAPVASLGRVVHAVADLAAAVALYRDVLGGRVTSTGAAVDGNHWVELGWRGAGRLRLLESAHGEIRDWVGDRPGRVRHLFFSYDEPAAVPGARQVAPGRFTVDADSPIGTRLVLSSTAHTPH